MLNTTSLATVGNASGSPCAAIHSRRSQYKFLENCVHECSTASVVVASAAVAADVVPDVAVDMITSPGASNHSRNHIRRHRQKELNDGTRDGYIRELI